MVRLFSTGFSKASFSPEVAFITLGETSNEASLVIERTFKTEPSSLATSEDFVISIDRLLLGFLPESLLPVIIGCTICVLFSLAISPFLISRAR